MQSKKKKSNEELIQSLMQSELQRKESVRESVKEIQRLTKSDATQVIQKINIHDIYPAPYNSEFNSFKPLNPDKAFELNNTILTNGLINPIIVLEANKEDMEELYKDDINNPYSFDGKRYLLLSGHSRTNSFYSLEAQGETEYSKIDAIIKRNLTIEEIKYYVKVSNICTREMSVAERRNNIKFMYRTLINQGTKANKVAKKISEDGGVELRMVQHQLRINDKLIDDLIDMYDNGTISLRNAIKLCNINKSLQQYMVKTYKENINNKILNNLAKSCDRKETIDILFSKKDVERYVNVNIQVPSELESKFRKMADNWIRRNG